MINPASKLLYYAYRRSNFDQLVEDRKPTTSVRSASQKQSYHDDVVDDDQDEDEVLDGEDEGAGGKD